MPFGTEASFSLSKDFEPFVVLNRWIETQQLGYHVCNFVPHNRTTA